MSVDLIKYEDDINCVGPGWHPLVRKLLEDLIHEGWDGNVQQIKEKFGGLRFYAGCVEERHWSLIRAAEQKSMEVCELCGEVGEPRNLRWIKTLCDRHYSERTWQALRRDA